MGTAWGSTRKAELLTGGKRWEARLKDEHLTLWLDSQPDWLHRFLQLSSLRVSSGLMWATRHIEFKLSSGRAVRTVGDSPNEQAFDMQRTLMRATAEALASFVAANAGKLESISHLGFERETIWKHREKMSTYAFVIGKIFRGPLTASTKNSLISSDLSTYTCRTIFQFVVQNVPRGLFGLGLPTGG